MGTATESSAVGFRYSRLNKTAEYNGQVGRYYLSAAGNDVGVSLGDVVQLTSVTGESAQYPNQVNDFRLYPGVATLQTTDTAGGFTTANVIVGVVMGWDIDTTDLYQKYLPAGTAAWLKIAIDTDAIYDVPIDDGTGSNGTLTDTALYTTRDLYLRTRSTDIFSQSNVYIDDATATTGLVQIVGLLDESTTAGNYYTAAVKFVRANFGLQGQQLSDSDLDKVADKAAKKLTGKVHQETTHTDAVHTDVNLAAGGAE